MEWENAKQKSGRTFVKATDIAVGASVVGKVLAIEPSKFEGKHTLLIEGTDGKEFVLLPSGTLNYDIADDVFEIGRTYKITRTESYENKRGVTVSAFEVLRAKLADNTAAGTKAAANGTSAKKVQPRI